MYPNQTPNTREHPNTVAHQVSSEYRNQPNNKKKELANRQPIVRTNYNT